MGSNTSGALTPPGRAGPDETRPASSGLADGVVRATPGPRHWETVERLCRAADARGNLVAAAQRAAVAIELGATWVTLDRDFTRFPGLRWVSPLDPPA